MPHQVIKSTKQKRKKATSHTKKKKTSLFHSFYCTSDSVACVCRWSFQLFSYRPSRLLSKSWVLFIFLYHRRRCRRRPSPTTHTDIDGHSSSWYWHKERKKEENNRLDKRTGLVRSRPFGSWLTDTADRAMNKSSTLLPFLFYFSPLSILFLFWYFISKRFRFFSVSDYRPRAHEPTTAYHLSYFLVLVPSVDFFLSYYFDFSSLWHKSQLTLWWRPSRSSINQTIVIELSTTNYFSSFISFLLFRFSYFVSDSTDWPTESFVTDGHVESWSQSFTPPPPSLADFSLVWPSLLYYFYQTFFFLWIDFHSKTHLVQLFYQIFLWFIYFLNSSSSPGRLRLF